MRPFPATSGHPRINLHDSSRVVRIQLSLQSHNIGEFDCRPMLLPSAVVDCRSVCNSANTSFSPLLSSWLGFKASLNTW